MTAKDLLTLLKQNQLTLGACESLTGGLFASTICEVPGASEVFMGALVTYTAKEKIALAHVDPTLIEMKGVVSSDVAIAMASGAKEALGVDIAVSCTGNAGPSQEAGDAGVGTVFLGLAYKNIVYCAPLHLSGERNQIRKETVDLMIDFIGSLFAKFEFKNQ